MPKITVGIPAYNAEKYIGIAIKSVLNQTFGDFELIITDDGSTDRTVEIARSFNDPRITVLADGQNKGISYRLNQQIDLAKGEYFARMDADDIMLPDRLERQYKYMIEHPNVDVIGGKAIVINENNLILGLRGTNYKERQYTHDIWSKGSYLIHPTVFGKTSFFLKFKYRDEYKGIEDVNLWFRSCDKAKLMQLIDIFILYRDPLRFKKETYLFRITQFRKFLRSNEVKNHLNKEIWRKKILRNYIQQITVSLVTFFNFDKFIISRRNKKFVGNLNKINNWINLLENFSDESLNTSRKN